MKINPADVEFIVNELEVSFFLLSISSFYTCVHKVLKFVTIVNEQVEKNVAERTLREYNGDAVAATRELLSRYPL